MKEVNVQVILVYCTSCKSHFSNNKLSNTTKKLLRLQAVIAYRQSNVNCKFVIIHSIDKFVQKTK